MKKTNLKLPKGKVAVSMDEPSSSKSVRSKYEPKEGVKRTTTYRMRDNDVSWYAKDPQLIKDAASLAFGEPLGPEVEYGPNKRSLPGVMVMYYAPTVGPIGLVAPGQAPINLAALNYYSFIRHANSGSRNYDPNDLIQILLGVGGVFELIAFGKRIYSLLRDYQLTNRYYSKRLLEAMNIDADDMLKHIADFRYYLNAAITRVGIYAIPNDMSFLLRRIWMCEGIWLDAPMRKAQTYMFAPLYVQKYDWSNAKVTLQPWTDASGSQATTDPNDVNYSTHITFDMFVHTVDDAISALAFNTDVGIISGDLLKAYGEAGLFKMSQIDADYHIEPSYSVEVLTQIHNATIVCSTRADINGDIDFVGASFDLIQNGALLTYNSTAGNPVLPDCWLLSQHCSPKYNNTNFGQVREDKILLDMPIDPVAPENVMVATRLTAVRKISSFSAGFGTAQFELANFGTEVILYSRIFSLVASWGYSTWLCNDSSLDISELLRYTTPFSFIPRGFVFVEQSDTPSTGETCWEYDEIEIGTVDNYTIITNETLFKQHQTAVVSEFSVPLSGLSRR